MKKPALALFAAALALGACSKKPADDLSALDNSIVGNDADPALTSALEDQITVDPALTQQSNRNAVRRTPGPVQAQYPPGASGMNALVGPGGACEKLDYNNAWAGKLPPAFAGVYSGGKITEAAGSDAPGCGMRVVTYTVAAAAQPVIDWYRDRAVKAGYSAEQQQREGDQILAGVNGDAVYFLIVTPKQAGSEVALIAR